MNSWIFPDACLAIFAKAPEPGKVKTRLLPVLSPDQAANLHRRLLYETLGLAHRQRLCRVQLWCSPSPGHPEFRKASTQYPISLHSQAGSDLGIRMNRAVTANLKDFAAVVLIGCDCPSLTLRDLIDSFSALRHGNDIVLGPAEDGGYVLIGMNRPVPELFHSMRWGTPEVLAESRDRIRRLGLRHHELRLHWDLDRPEDLRRYRLLKGMGSSNSDTGDLES